MSRSNGDVGDGAPKQLQCPYCFVAYSPKTLHECLHIETTFVRQLSAVKEELAKAREAKALADAAAPPKLEHCPYCKAQYSSDKMHICHHIGYLPATEEKSTKKQKLSADHPKKCPYCQEQYDPKKNPVHQCTSGVQNARESDAARPFKCTLCNASYVYESGLLSHLRKHAEPKAKKFYL